ncbi:MAG: hypothetical protein AAB091_00670 [Elusimicrobiota bacterium]
MPEISGVFSTAIAVHADERGTLWKLIQAQFNERFAFGETYLTAAKPGVWRAGHYHEEIREWFIVIEGRALFRFYNLDTDERLEMEVAAEDRLRLEVAPRVAHSFKNTGPGPLLLLAIASKCYDSQKPDTYAETKVAFS